MTIKVQPGSVLFADSISTAKIKIGFEKPLSKDQSIKITTSHGTLYSMPYQPFGAGSTELVLTPFSKETEILLRASTLVPQDSVYVSVTVENYTKNIAISFLESFPEDLMFSKNQQFIDLGEDIDLSLSFYKSKGYVSDGVRLDIEWILEAGNGGQDSLLTNIPSYIFTKNHEAKIPIDVVRHSSGSRLRVIGKCLNPDGDSLIRSTVLWFN